jgi:hypothetical protein
MNLATFWLGFFMSKTARVSAVFAHVIKVVLCPKLPAKI